MRLKVFVTVTIGLATALLLAWPWVLAARPRSGEALRQYSVQFALYVTVLLVLLLISGIGAVYVARQAREEYAAQRRENLRELVEGTLQDHREKNRDDA
jgi:uncharacterized membrane protein YphA (DoxX/SURF4 family)